jgi:TonB family protein
MKKLAMLVAVLLAGAALTAQDDPLSTARDLYAAAAYEEALSELTRVGSSAPAPETARDSNAYRVFCLVALGRSPEAETVAESLIRADPMLTLDRYRDVSPRIVSLFATVRGRVLPQLIRDEYRTARALATEKAPDAQSRLTHVVELLGEAKKIGAWDETLADLRLLVDGFLELSRVPAPEIPSIAAPASASAPAPAAAPATVAEAPPASTSPPAAPIRAADGETGVVAPVVVFQPAPQAPRLLLDLVRKLHRTGTFDVVIDERGLVEDVIVRQSMNAAYDALVVATARTWKYRPATKEGVPVRYVKTVAINVPAQ